MTERLVVIGGDAAGMSAASQARRRRDRDDLEIVAFERGRFTSFSACGIPYWIAGLVDERDDLVARAPQTFRDRFDIDVHLESEVVAIDTGRGRVEVWDHAAGQARWEPYDQLMVATGGRPIRPQMPGIEAEGIFGVQTLDDGAAVNAFLDARPVEAAVVVGGGYIGLEMAEAMVHRGVDVRLVEAAGQLMPTLDADVAAGVVTALEGIGVEVVLDTPVQGFAADGGGRVRAVTTPAGDLPAELVFLGLGTRPETQLAEEAGLEIGASGGVVTDPRQHTGTERVWAAGDCTEVFHRVARRGVAIALGTIANKQGRVAGINLGGGNATFPGVLGTAITRVCGLEMARTGLTETGCERYGLPAVGVTLASTTRAGYFPGADPMTVKVTVAPDSGRLLGAQIVGGDTAAKRIDAFAMALWNEMTVGDMLNVDLSYAPPFSGVWDPVLAAARKAWQVLG
jgi:NADPH-dependent 2,4-dienoyl-CoA reductase/sulfur reductase-like enzyme